MIGLQLLQQFAEPNSLSSIHFEEPENISLFDDFN